MRRVAEPIVADLNRTTDETVFFAELVGKLVVCFAIVQGTRPLRLFVDLGRALPSHAAASARVMLAHLDEASVAGLLADADFSQWTPKTIIDRATFVRHLALVRSRGYDVCDNEMPDHEWAVAAPLRDVTSKVRASIAVVAPLATVGDVARRARL